MSYHRAMKTTAKPAAGSPQKQGSAPRKRLTPGSLFRGTTTQELRDLATGVVLELIARDADEPEHPYLVGGTCAKEGSTVDYALAPDATTATDMIRSLRRKPGAAWKHESTKPLLVDILYHLDMIASDMLGSLLPQEEAPKGRARKSK